MNYSKIIAAFMLIGLTVSVNADVTLLDIIKRPAFLDIKMSGDGKYFAGTAVTDKGKIILKIVDRKSMKITTQHAFDSNYGVGSFRWMSDTRVMFELTYDSAQSEGQSPTGVMMAMNVDGTEKRMVWDHSNAGAGNGGQLMGPAGKDHYYVNVFPSGSSASEFPYTYLYKLNIKTGKAHKVMKSPSRAGGTGWITNKGKVTHYIGRRPDSFDHDVVHRRVDGKWILEGDYAHAKGTSLPISWHKDGKKILYVDNLNTQTKGYYWVDVKSRKKSLIYHNPKVDVSSFRFDEDGEIWGVAINYDYPTMVYLNKEAKGAKLHMQLAATFPYSYVRVSGGTKDEKVVSVRSDRDRGQFYLYNVKDKTLAHLLNPNPSLPASKVGKTLVSEITARDGLKFVGYLTVPPGKDPKNLPLIILPHGGPHGLRDDWFFYTEGVAFANVGYAVLRVNYRGSGGYGKDFHYNGYRRWGLEMQDDLTDAANWAVKAGFADKDRMCIYGASYGGYAALMGVVKTPDLFKCAIGYVGVFDLNIMNDYGDIS